MAGVTVEDWQSNKSTLACNRYMLANQTACDIIFLVGECRVRMPAHKYILISRSCVFYSMFCGPLAETNSDISLPDIEPDIFKALLLFLYCEELDIQPHMVLPLLYAAKKYSIQTLVRKCIQYLELDQSSENICAILEQAHMYDEKDLERKCMEYICGHAKDVIQSDDFLELSPTSLMCILKSDKIQVDEKTVLTFVEKWASRECERKGWESFAANKRKALGPLLYQIRFPLLGEKYFTEIVADMDILNDTEKVELFKFFYKTGSKVETFVTSNRFVNNVSSCSDSFHSDSDTRPIQTCMRYRTVYEDGSWYCGGEPDAVAFMCNRTIHLSGVLVYGSYIGEGVYDVTCSVYDNTEKEIVTRQTSLKTSESQHTYPVLLEAPIEIPKSKKHVLVVKLISSEGLDTYQGKNGMSSVSVGTVQFTFSKSKYSRNGTDVKIGQIPGLLFTCNEEDFEEF